jgi:colanic acid biosynthesis glycosyl transferase WcaI
LQFVFVGGGAGKAEVEAYGRTHQLQALRSLPYQPIEGLTASLSAGDVHVVSLGDAMVGIIHPSKVYGVLAVGRPVLYLGPAPSHVSEIIREHRIGWEVRHGDVDGMVAVLGTIASLTPAELAEIGGRARRAFEHEFARGRLCGRFTDLVVESLRLDRR